MKLVHDLNPEVVIHCDSEHLGMSIGSVKYLITALDIAYAETRAALVAMVGKPVDVVDRYRVVTPKPKVHESWCYTPDVGHDGECLPDGIHPDSPMLSAQRGGIKYPPQP